MDRFEPTEEQRAVIDHRGSHMLVFAGPGTGKTETLARRFASIVHDDEVPAGRILVLTFSRRAADAMRARIVTRMRERAGKGIAVPELHVSTFHGFCNRLLDGDGPRGARRDLLNPVKERLLWARAIEGVRLRTFGPEVIASTTFANAVLNLIARLKGDGVSVEAFAATAKDDRLADLAELYQRMDALRGRLGLADFRDLVADAVRALHQPDSAANAWLRDTAAFAHVLVDEFQDSDAMQLQLLEAMRGDAQANPPSPEMCFVGDFNQSIYRFRGANPDNIAEARKRFQCTEFVLHVNRRSAQAILDVANLTPRLDPTSLTTAEPGGDGVGSVRLVEAETVESELATVADAVAARVRSGTAPEKIAVLLRVLEPYRGAIARELEARGVPVAAHSSAGFHEDSLIDAVKACWRLLAGERDLESWRHLLVNPLVGFAPLSVTFALSKRSGEGPGEIRRALDADPPAGRIEWAAFTRALEAARAAGGPPYRFDPAALAEGIVRELDLLWPIRDGREVPGFHPTASPARLAALLQAARDVRDMHVALGGERLNAASFLQLLDEVVAVIGEPYEVPQSEGDGVAVMSIHAAKGLEFDFVIVPQLVDGVLPSHARADALMGDRHVPYAKALEDAALEEASLWYVAVTRARYDVLATAARTGDDGAEQALSPFAFLIARREAETSPMPPVRPSRASAFAAAFAQATDDQRRAPEVQAFIAERPVLAAYLRDGTLPKEALRGVRWDLDRLSPSGIERYIVCPRRWFYHYALQLAENTDDLTRMGIFVHRVLERYHTSVRDFSDPTAAPAADRIIADLVPIADQEAQRAAKESGLPLDSAMFAYERARIMRQLGTYARWLVDEAARDPFEVIACEHRVDIALGDIRLVGRVDRVDRRTDGSLVVRDYKSGKMHDKASGKVLDDALARIEPDVAGFGLFGNAPAGLKMQTLLYVRGVEAEFAQKVARADYLYLAGSKGDDGTVVDSVEIDDDVRAQLDLIYDTIARGIASELMDESLTSIPTAIDEAACKYCAFTSVCPGPGSFSYPSEAATP